MSHALHQRAAAQGAATCTRDFADSLLASGAPCALLDRSGIVRAASATLTGAIPGLIGRPIAQSFQIDSSELVNGAGNAGQISGVYTGVHGELVPAILQCLYGVDDGETTLVLVNDGAPFRRAEAERFHTAPFTVIRIKPDGGMRFANPAAAETFHRQAPSDLVGRPLVSLFAAADRTHIESGLAACLDGKAPEPILAATAALEPSQSEPMRLMLMPDQAPDGRCLGAVAVVHGTSIEQARDEIRKVALDPARDWRQRLRAILGIVQPLIDFDHAAFGIYAENVSLYRAVLIEPPHFIEWPARWMQLPPSINDWIKEGDTWIPDLKKFLDGQPELRDTEVAREYVKRGIVSSVTLPTSGPAGTSSSLSLCSLSKDRYGERDLNLLRQLDLEPILLRLEADVNEEREAFWREMTRTLGGTQSLQESGKEIVDQVARHFDWDHVSLFRVNRRKERFELVIQHSRSPQYALKNGFTQPIAEGMLGATLERECVLIVDDVKAEQSQAYDYDPVSPKCRSAMTAPLRLNGRIRWIVDAESSVSHTFRGPDRVAIEKLIEAIELGLGQRMTLEIKSGLLHETQQGVVVAGMEGAILEINEVAARLLGKSRPLPETGVGTKLLPDYGADDHSRGVLNGELSTSSRRIEMLGDDGKTRAVLATRRDFDPSFDTALWFFTDLEALDWSRELRFLRETVTDVAQQTRGPLALASTLVRQLPLLAKGETRGARRGRSTVSALEKMCERVMAEVGKADITFERLADRLEIFKEPCRTRDRIDLGDCVNDVVQLLPERDRKRIDLLAGSEPVAIAGDAGRISFVARSIVAHLLRCRPDDDTRVEVRIGRERRRAVLAMHLTAESRGGHATDAASHDALWKTLRAAREDASLGLKAVEHVVRAHGGTLSKRARRRRKADPSPPWLAFTVKLPRY